MNYEKWGCQRKTDTKKYKIHIERLKNIKKIIMKIEKIQIDKLTPWKNNAKEHPKEQVEQIKQSIKMYGNNDPIAVWGDKNIIVEGHGRYQALKELGETEVEIIRLDHLTDEQRREYTLVHNQTTMNSGWDFGKLEEELKDLDFEGVDFGFDMDFDTPEQKIKEGEEIDLDEYEDKNFECECPRCGFKFNGK